MWLKCSQCSKNCFFTVLSAFFFELPITRTPDTSHFFRFPLRVRVIGSRMYSCKRLYTRNKTNSGYKANVSLRTFQMPAPNAYEQCILAYKQQNVYFVTSNDSGLILSPCLIKNSRNIHVRSVTWLIFCSEIAFAWSMKTFEKQWF